MKTPNGLTPFNLWSKGGWPRVDVVGEFYHQDEIRALLPRATAEGTAELEATALLLPEPHNRHDPNAVRVEIDGRLVGHLSRDIAGDYAPILSRLVSTGLAPATPCRIWAYERDEWKGTDRKGRDLYERVLSASVTVVLDAPHLIVPMNLPPERPHRVLPHGSALQVRGEEKHLDTLAPWVAAHGEGWVYGELQVAEVPGARSSKQLIEILLDGQVIGELTPAMSAHFLPVVDHAQQRDECVLAKVFLKGNQLKVEAVLHAAKAHELPTDWLGGAGLSTALPAAPSGPQPSAPSATPGEVGHDFELPPKPTRIVFNPAPGWPPPPAGWEPPPGWKPSPDWPKPPEDWTFWTVE